MYYDITVDSSGYYFYEYFSNAIFIEPQAGSVSQMSTSVTSTVFVSSRSDLTFNVSVNDNINFLVVAEPQVNSGFQSSVNVVYEIATALSISCSTTASVGEIILQQVDVSGADLSVSILISSVDVFTPGGGEDTSDIKPFFMLDSVPLTEHNRKTNVNVQPLNINSSNWIGKKSVYYKKKPSKRLFNIQWTFVPGKRENTVDFNAGRDYIYSKSTDPRNHVLEIRNLDTNGLTPYTTEVYNVLVSEYTEVLVRRDLVGDDYYWNCSLSLEEV
jgi:hypothetical protein